jgi:hypothetical protein
VTGTDALDLAQIQGRSRELHDRDLLAELLLLLRDESSAQTVRLAVIDVLISYHVPGAGLSSAYQIEDYDVGLCGLGMRTHFRYQEGANPIGSEDRAAIRQALATAAELGANASVRRAATCASAALNRHTSARAP